MAKGIGNGFPMAAVVTTPDIAKSLQHALHFNTFGGSPLACAVASTVLDVSQLLNIIHRDHRGMFFHTDAVRCVVVPRGVVRRPAAPCGASFYYTGTASGVNES